MRRFTRQRVVPAAAIHEAADSYPADLVGDMASMGLFGVTIAEEHGGLGLDLGTYTAIVEELAWGWMSVTGFLNTHVMAAFLISTFGTDDQKARLLPAMATGATRGAYSMSEPDAGSDVAAITTRAVRDGDGWVLDGTKAWVTNGRMAGVVAMLVRTPNASSDDPPGASPGGTAHRRHEGFSVVLVEKEPGATTAGGLTVGRQLEQAFGSGLQAKAL